MKFDFCIGNPPYQLSTDVNNRAEPIYPYFMMPQKKYQKDIC